jgi:SAM-dependent methyltransferase
MTKATDPIGERYRRLDAFLARLKADIYPEPPNNLHTHLTQHMFAEVRKLYDLPEGAVVLDVGCGQGLALEQFRAAGFQPIGVTMGEDAEICRAKGFDIREQDFSFLDFDDATFDLIWCRHAIEHSVFPYFMLSEMHRMLKPGGLLYVEVPIADTGCKHQTNPNHYSVLGKSMWVSLIQRAGFPEVRIRDLNFTTGLGPDTYWAFMQRKPA